MGSSGWAAVADDEPTTDAPTALITRTGCIVLAVATLLFVGLASVQAWHDGPTIDEAYTLASGVSALTRHDLRVVPQHPPLGKVLAALPVLLFHPPIPNGAIWDRAANTRGGRDRVGSRILGGGVVR